MSFCVCYCDNHLPGVLFWICFHRIMAMASRNCSCWSKNQFMTAEEFYNLEHCWATKRIPIISIRIVPLLFSPLELWNSRCSTGIREFQNSNGENNSGTMRREMIGMRFVAQQCYILQEFPTVMELVLASMVKNLKNSPIFLSLSTICIFHFFTIHQDFHQFFCSFCGLIIICRWIRRTVEARKWKIFEDSSPLKQARVPW